MSMPSPGAAAVELVGITKRFPGVVANQDITLAIRGGEIHALLGENGAGKSTLIAILAGLQQADQGEIRITGRPVAIDSPRAAIDLGIGTVFQHATLVPTLTVIENLMLGGPWYRLRDRQGTGARLSELSDLLGIVLDPDTLAGQLALGQQQQIEIIKALWRGERLLVLDEPTSMLTPQGVRDLGGMLRRLRDSGIAILFITHKLDEATALGDRISVLKAGRLVGALPPETLSSLTEEEARVAIVALMFGPKAEATTASFEQFHGEGGGTCAPLGEPILELLGASACGDPGEASVREVGFSVSPGEVFGLAGVDGNGQKQLAELLAGQRRLDGGDIRLGGESIAGLSIAQRQGLGLRYVTDDRLGEGSVAELSLALNLVMKRVGAPPFWRLGLTQQAAIDAHAEALIRAYDIRTSSSQTPIGALSGGNIQKALLAREHADSPRVVIYNKPTHGLDLANTRATRARIRAEAAKGVATILISNELDELLELCGRVGVMLGGELQGIVENGPEAETRIGELMIGARGRDDR